MADIDEYVIAKIKNKYIPYIKEKQYQLVSFKQIEEMKEIISEDFLLNQIMSKDYKYINHRYFEHPLYNYDYWKIVKDDGVSNSVLITREECLGASKCCKIVDYYGDIDDFKYITKAIDEIMIKNNYEFVDIYSFGVDRSIYKNAGFVHCGNRHENIIPNYFHPFEQKNIELKFANPMISGLRFFRGDGDQDRPC